MTKGKSINIYLPDGNPKGVKKINITTFPLKAIVVPKNLINEANGSDELLDRTGIYFLFSEKEENSLIKTYIGEGNLVSRLKNHYKNKEDWNFAVCFYGDSEDGLNKVQVGYLEAYSILEATKLGQTKLQNKKEQVIQPAPDYEEEFILQFLDEIKFILDLLGYPILSPAKKAETEEEIFFCKSKLADAKGNLTEDGFLVYEGSRINKENTASLGAWVLNIKNKLISEGTLKDDGDSMIFTKDFVFNSPSAAAAVVVGRPANGWTGWRNKEGKTLDELKRQEDN